MGTRPAIFKWRRTKPGLILRAVRWYLRYSLSLRAVEELLEERGLDVDQAAALKVATHPSHVSEGTWGRFCECAGALATAEALMSGFVSAEPLALDVLQLFWVAGW